MLGSRFFQTMKYNGQGFNLSRLRSATYVESLDLSGPKLMLVFNDTDSSMIDLIGLKEHEGILEVEFSDPLERDGTNFRETFIIESMGEAINGGVRVDCLAEAVSNIKREADSTTIFAAGSPLLAVRAITGVDPIGSSFPAGPEYHLLMGMRPSRLLKNIATEIGARIFYCRGQWHVISYDDLFAAATYKTMTHNMANSYEPITGVINLGAQKVTNEIGRSRLSGWSMTDGIISSGTGRAMPTGIDTAAGLREAGRFLVPQIEFKMPVNADSEIIPSSILEIEWHRPNNPDAPMNESMPDKVLVGTIAHHYESGQFMQRAITLMEAS